MAASPYSCSSTHFFGHWVIDQNGQARLTSEDLKSSTDNLCELYKSAMEVLSKLSTTRDLKLEKWTIEGAFSYVGNLSKHRFEVVSICDGFRSGPSEDALNEWSEHLCRLEMVCCSIFDRMLELKSQKNSKLLEDYQSAFENFIKDARAENFNILDEMDNKVFGKIYKQWQEMDNYAKLLSGSRDGKPLEEKALFFGNEFFEARRLFITGCFEHLQRQTP